MRRSSGPATQRPRPGLRSIGRCAAQFMLLLLLVPAARPAQATEAFDYLSGIVTSLTEFKDQEGAGHARAAPASLIDSLRRDRTLARTAQRARDRVEGFAGSDNDGIANSARGLSRGFAGLHAIHADLADMIEAALDEPRAEAIRSDDARQRMSQAQSRTDGEWQGILRALTDAEHGMVDESRLVDGRVERLLLTRAELASVRDQLRAAFGDAVFASGFAASSFVDFGASVIAGFIAQPWRGSDEP